LLDLTSGDSIEINAIESVFAAAVNSGAVRNAPLYVSSTKGATGHLLGAAGAIESAFCALSIRDGMVPPTINLTDMDAESKPRSVDGQPPTFEHVPVTAKKYGGEGSTSSPRLLHALNNSFGFGGTNASLIFSHFEP
jgi:3-oxoacyl-[acyl-carrier-protein] synthase II